VYLPDKTAGHRFTLTGRHPILQPFRRKKNHRLTAYFIQPIAKLLSINSIDNKGEHLFIK